MEFGLRLCCRASGALHRRARQRTDAPGRAPSWRAGKPVPWRRDEPRFPHFGHHSAASIVDCKLRVGLQFMTVTGIANSLRGLGIGLPVLILCVAPAAAQYPGQNPGRSQTCLRLESQLATLDRGVGVDPARADQIKRYEDASAKQQAELDRLGQQSQRLGCQGGGFFALFSGQSPQCGPLNNQIQQMRANLDRNLTEVQRLQGNSGEREGQRRGILVALGQNDCGPQYRQYANSGPGGFFENLFGGGGVTQSARRTARRHLQNVVRANLRRLLLPDLLFDRAGQVRRRRATVPAPVPGRRGRPLQPSQSRRGRRTRGLDQRQILFRTAQRVQLPQAVQCRLPVPCARPILGRGPAPEPRARSRPDRGARRHRRHRGAGQAIVAAALRRAGQTGQARRQPPGREHRCRLRCPARRRGTAAPAAEEKAEEPGKRKVRAVGPTFYPVR